LYSVSELVGRDRATHATSQTVLRYLSICARAPSRCLALTGMSAQLSVRGGPVAPPSMHQGNHDATRQSATHRQGRSSRLHCQWPARSFVFAPLGRLTRNVAHGTVPRASDPWTSRLRYRVRVRQYSVRRTSTHAPAVPAIVPRPRKAGLHNWQRRATTDSGD